MRRAKPEVLYLYQGSQIPKTFIIEPNLALLTLDTQSRGPNKPFFYYYYSNMFLIPYSSISLLSTYILYLFIIQEIISKKTKRFL
jgi:hypothetical protein